SLFWYAAPKRSSQPSGDCRGLGFDASASLVSLTIRPRTRGPARPQQNELRLTTTVLHTQQRQSNLPVEPHAPGGARVHPKHTVPLGDERLVSVTVDNYSRVRTRHGVDESMHKVQLHARQLHIHPQRQAELS